MQIAKTLLVLVVVLCVAGDATAADCSVCGKQLKWGFGTCADCKRRALDRAGERARSAADRVREAAPRVRERVDEGRRRVQETWERRAPELRERAGRLVERARPIVREGVERFREETLPRMREWGRDVSGQLGATIQQMDRDRAGRFLTDLGARFRDQGPAFAGRLAEFYSSDREHLLGPVSRLVDSCRPQINRLVRDPEVRDKLMAGFVTAVDIHDRVGRLKDRALAEGLDIVGNRIPVFVNGQKTTLNRALGDRLSDIFPHVEGTTIASEPVQALTYVFVAHDTGYIMRDLRVIKGRDGRARSVAECFEAAPGADAEGIIGALDVAEKAVSFSSSLRKGDGVLDTSLAFANSVRNLQDSRR